MMKDFMEEELLTLKAQYAGCRLVFCVSPAFEHHIEEILGIIAIYSQYLETTKHICIVNLLTRIAMMLL